MHIGQQLSDFSDRRLALEAQLGVEHIATGPTLVPGLADEKGRWKRADLEAFRDRFNLHGLALEVLSLETDSLFRSMAMHQPDTDQRLAVALDNIRTAASTGIPCLKYRFHPIGVLRTHVTPGRGGLQYKSFDFTRYDESKHDAEALFRYDEQVNDVADLRISVDKAWEVLERFLKAAVPVAEEVDIKLAIHPQDPPMPPDADLNVHHVLGSFDALQRFLDLYPSPVNGLNFCQGTVAEMCENPATEVLDAIRRFGAQRKIFMVHFRNIRGGYLNFQEVLPDEGDVDMLAAIRAYREVGYDGMLCPDHVPHSDSDPDGERQFSFALGYIRGLIQVANT